MLGHDQSKRRRLRRAAVWLALPVLIGFGLSRHALGEQPISSESVSLGANRVRHWSDADDRWLLLEGKVNVGKGLDAFQADRAVARIFMGENPSGRKVRRIDVYAEGTGDGRFRPSASASRRWTVATTGDVLLSASTQEKLEPLAAEPEGVPFLAKSKTALAPPTPRPVAPPFDPALVQASATVPESAVAPKPDPYKVDRKDVDLPARLRDPSYKPVQFIDKGVGFPESPAGPTLAPPVGAAAEPPLRPKPDPFGTGNGPSLDAPATGNGAVENVDDDDPPAPPAGANSPLGATPAPPNLDAPESGATLDPIPGGGARRTPSGRPAPPPPTAPIMPGSRRVTSIYIRSGPNVSWQNLPTASDGTNVTVVKGGINIVTNAPQLGTIDMEADEAVIFRKKNPGSGPAQLGENGEIVESSDEPMEVYLQGHVVVRQDRREVEGNSDQATFRAKRAYYDVRADRFVGLDAEVDVFAPGLIAPMRISTPRADYFHPITTGPNGAMVADLPEIRAFRANSTGSRFANPGYRFQSRSIDVKKVFSDNFEQNSGQVDGAPGFTAKQTTWRVDARSNVFYMGPVPVFYWPRFVAEADDLDPPLRQIAFRTNNYFGQQLLSDWNGFKVFGIRKPPIIDVWNLDLDYLSYRGFGLGSELGWFGSDLMRDLTDPYHKKQTFTPGLLTNYAGYLDVWGIKDGGVDVLGGGPAVVTATPAAGKAGYQRTSVPSFQDYRGRINLRHMQSLLQPDADPYEDFRINLEAGYLSDRQFEEQYYKRLFDTGLDHETLIYGIRQKENWAFTAMTEANLMMFNTESQWLPKLDYYRFGDSLFSNLFNYYGHTGVDYAVTHTANEVNNKNIFAYIPYDPISNTSNVFSSGRAYTAHELEMPINLDFVRITPYVQGQAVGWTNQLNGDPTGRYWGGAGAKADVMAWRAYPEIESELFNVHGLNHKVNFVADARATYSNVALNRLGVQDDLDDNTYEFVRRYFALTGYAGGILPMQYDPRFLLLRRAASPIATTTDVQGSIDTIQLGVHQRLQTKRGPEGKRRIIDYMVFDLDTTYFPYASRDNFNKPFGQNTYHFEWYIGDRTSIVSDGWFEFFNIAGTPLFKVNPQQTNDPFGLNVITTGVNVNRPPMGSLFLGYSVINTGPINTSALIASSTYWLSPKWYTSAGTTYDFGNAILLGANASITRLGKDYLTSVGLNVDPQRRSYMFSFEIAPRLSPNLRFGSATGLQRLDTRYAPVQ